MVKSIVEAVFRHAEEQPDKLCLADEQGTVTYAQYAEKIQMLAFFFQRQGLQKGDTVVVEAQQTISCLAVELALHLLGGVFVPVERDCAAEKIETIAKHSEAKLIVAEKTTPGTHRTYTYSQVLEEAKSAPKPEPVCFPTGEEISEILFSTGTTGKEKGIVLTHDNDIALAENVMYGVQMQPDNVEIIPLPLNHSHGLRRYYGNMLCGGTVVLASGVINVKGFFGAMDKYHVNSIDLVPAALSVLLKLSKNKLAEYRDVLRYIQLGAAPLMEADKEKIKSLLPDTRLYNFYGSTESGCICIHEFGQGRDKKNCIGKPTRHADILITDENRQAIRSSEKNSGLLASRGKMNMIGYWKDPEETAGVLSEGTVYSNDEAYFDEDGDIILLGRRGDVINVGGNKVSPEEIENAAKKLPEIADCGCVPIQDELRGHVPKLFVEMADGCIFDAVAIRTHLTGCLESYKIPQYIERIEKVPRTYNGKLLRRELAKLM